MKKANRGNLPAMLLLLAVLMLWQLGAMEVNAAYILPTPVQILEKLWALRQPLFTVHLPATMGVTGLGLAIVQEIARRHNVTIQVESREGEGTTFIFIFPRK